MFLKRRCVLPCLPRKQAWHSMGSRIEGGKIMLEVEFTELVKTIVADYTNEHLDKSDDKKITKDDVYIVWTCKTLQNSKALASTNLLDGMYYELTYNGDNNELYLDAYKKFENRCITC